jgi:uncharacterized RDD family membrane protein YckC
MAKWRDVKKGKIPLTKEKLTVSQTSLTQSATIGSRLKAFLTDTFLITTPIFYVVIYFIMGGGEEFAQNRVEGWSLIFGLHATIILFFWTKKAQTPGLKAYSLKVIHATTHQKITFSSALIRYITTLFAVVSILLLFIPFFRKDKRTFQDIFSSTSVVPE